MFKALSFFIILRPIMSNGKIRLGLVGHEDEGWLRLGHTAEDQIVGGYSLDNGHISARTEFPERNGVYKVFTDKMGSGSAVTLGKIYQTIAAESDIMQDEHGKFLWGIKQ